MDNYVKGIIREIIYTATDGFCVGILKIKETNIISLNSKKSIPFAGIIENPEIDLSVILYGTLVNHPKYGKQIKVSHCEKLLPEEKNNIITFLSSKTFPNVGEKTAKKIVNTLGNKTLELILNDYTCLLKVPIKEKKAKEIHDILVKEELSYKTIIYLTDIGFNNNEAVKIYEYYKNQTLNIIDKNIYTVLEIPYITFNKVDSVALSLGILKDDEKRINACITNTILDMCYETGSTCFSFDDIYNSCIQILDIDITTDKFNYYLEKLNNNKYIIIIDNKYTLSYIYEIELFIANKLKNLNNICNKNIKVEDKTIEQLQKKYKIKYNDLQKEAIKLSLENNLTIITGGPGTGKTTIIKGIVEAYKKMHKYDSIELAEKLVLIAPTGRAARRMSITSGFKASTIHSFLKWDKETNIFSLNEHNKSDAKVIIIDESSMIDLNLFYNLLKALKDDVKLIMVGDYDQLPSVSYGEVLKDIIDSNSFKVIKLHELYRQKDDSYIVTLSKSINEGDVGDFLSKRSDYSFIKCDGKSVKEGIIKICEMALEKGYDYNKIQVLIPMYKGISGVDNINNVLQGIFNPKDFIKDEYYYQGTLFREGDKVLLTKNYNDMDISNGDIGIIDRIEYDFDDEVCFTINFDGIIAKFDKKKIDNLKLGYAITTHKSQGSEFEVVIMPIVSSYKRMLYKKLIYTGVTRAKKLLILLGEPDSFLYSINNTIRDDRDTFLLDLLKSINISK